MRNNVRLLQFIIPLTTAWFWLGIWLPYYLKFTNYSGVALLEAIIITLGVALEIPTGAIADIFGKRKTMIIALIFISGGELFTAMANSVIHLWISVGFLGAGAALMSGTWEALLYDSLKQENYEESYAKVMSSIATSSLLVLAFCSAAGGFLYQYHYSLPFFATTIAYIAALLMSFWLVEPYVEEEKFSILSYLRYTKRGFKELLKDKRIHKSLILLLLVYGISLILMDLMDTALAINFGLSEHALGILYAGLPLITALGVHLYPILKPKIHTESFLLFILLTFSLSVLISPFVGIVLGVAFICYRNIFYSVINVVASDVINSAVDSRYRATTLSTFSMLNKLPYVIFVVFIGHYLDLLSPTFVAYYMGILFILFTLIYLGVTFLKSRK